MTFSILARDPETGAMGGAAATGSLCVGGWVLWGRLRAGMSASQGAAPSTFWGEEVLAEMSQGRDAVQAVRSITAADGGREYRQLTALDPNGGTGAFTGNANEPERGHRSVAGGIVAGNMLVRIGVLDAMAERFASTKGDFGHRLLASLQAAAQQGGDFRGLLSAALLILHPDRPPLTLRIDYHATDPIGALVELHNKAISGAYARWAEQVPVLNDRERILA